MAEKWARWTLAEIAVMKRHYPNMPRNELLRFLPGRTWRAIMGAAERYGFRRDCDIPKSEKQQAALHAKMSTARCNRTQQPFADNHHSAEAKLAISVSNLHARGHSIADIAKRNGIAKQEVKKIIKNKKEGNKRK